MLIYLRDTALTDRTVQDFREKLTGPLGFDIEYRPNFTKGCPLNRTALVQLASESLVLLVQVSAMSAFPDSIKNIIEDPAIVKAGVGIQGDANKLRRDFGVHPAGCLELSFLAKAVDPQWADAKGPLISLARLVEAYEERVIKKPKHLQMSNWERPLTEEQQDYAAGDATAALSVLQKLYTILPSVQPPPDKTLYIF
ncbi:ribonuclease H-like domain-containing protein [Gautieria morchelliformis]|nr:ribonuclease H-like domain-containing protein [Gautieria morchelliformis]